MLFRFNRNEMERLREENCWNASNNSKTNQCFTFFIPISFFPFRIATIAKSISRWLKISIFHFTAAKKRIPQKSVEPIGICAKHGRIYFSMNFTINRNQLWLERKSSCIIGELAWKWYGKRKKHIRYRSDHHKIGFQFFHSLFDLRRRETAAGTNMVESFDLKH